MTDTLAERHSEDERSSEPAVKVLMVDDHPSNLLVLEAILEDLGHELVRSTSGEEALQLLAQADYAVVLLDVQMQGWDGFETAKRIREQERSRETPIVFLTAFESNSVTIEEAYALGAVDYLVKPVHPIVVRAKVKGFVELYLKTERVKRQAEQIRQLAQRDFEQKLARENARLQESEARKSAILDTALDCIITIDHAGRIVEFNPAAEQTFGYSEEYALGRDIAELIIPASLREKHQAGLSRFLATGQGPILGRRIEMPAVRVDGETFAVELAITRISTSGPPLFTAYLRDISDRKRADGRRNARMAVTQALAEAAELLCAAPRILQAVCEGLGWDVGGLWARQGAVLKCVDVWTTGIANTHNFETTSREQTFEIGIGLPGRVWKNAHPAWIPDVTADSNFPRATVALEAGLHGAFGCPILHGSEVLGVIEFFSRHVREPDPDLLEMMNTLGGQIGQFIVRKRAEEVLRDSERRFARFMQHLPGLAWIKDLQGCYVFANEAAQKAFQRSQPELYGKTDEEVFPAETARRFRDNDREALASATGIQVIETLSQPEGIRRSIVSKFPISDADGTPLMIGGIAIDVTDRLQAEEALQEANRRKDEFLATLAHELRNPLAPIRNGLQLIGLAGRDWTLVDQARSLMERQMEQMVRLVDDLLDVSRITRNILELRKARIELADVLRGAIETSHPSIEALQHALQTEIPAEPLPLYADMTRLVQVFANLLNNAAKYTPQGGRIKLTARRAGATAIVTVSDSGIGIPAEILPRVFEMFTQSQRSLPRSQGGLGIGLTLAKRLAEMHGGHVTAASGGEGQGSVFTVTLPLADSQLEGKLEGVSPMQDNPAATRQRRLLVVDDNVDSANSLAMVLRLTGHEALTAHDGESALKVAEESRPEIILLDIGLPTISGYEVAQRIRQQPWGQSIVLIACTGWGQADDKRRTQEAGFNHHLVKPLDLAALKKLLDSLSVAPTQKT